MVKSFKALRVYKNGVVGAKIESLAINALPPGEVLIESCYSSVNYKDALAATGQGNILKSFPMTAGIDVSGVVVESQNARFNIGDEVLVTGYGLGQDQDGGFSEYVRVPADWVVRLEPGLSLREAMILGTAGFTAGLAVQKMLDNHQAPALGPVLVTGASGGVGSFAVHILSRLGFEVIALTGKPEAAQYLQSLGASSVWSRDEMTFSDKPLEASRWAGAIDTLGGSVLDWVIRSTSRHGNIASCGMVAGSQVNTNVMPFILRGVNVLGIDSATCPMAYRQQVWCRLATDLKPDCFERILTKTLSLTELTPMFSQMLCGKTQGRYLVKLSA